MWNSTESTLKICRYFPLSLTTEFKILRPVCFSSDAISYLTSCHSSDILHLLCHPPAILNTWIFIPGYTISASSYLLHLMCPSVGASPPNVNLTNTFCSSRLIQVYSLRNYWPSKKLLISVSLVMAKHTEDVFKKGRRKKEGTSLESTFYRILKAGCRWSITARLWWGGSRAQRIMLRISVFYRSMHFRYEVRWKLVDFLIRRWSSMEQIL